LEAGVRRGARNELIDAPDDGLPAAEVGAWAERKYRVVRAYAEMFSTGMKNRWETLVYVDLFAGSGHAFLGATRRRVLTSPLIALRVPDPFTKYVFCEANPTLCQALGARIAAMAPQSSVKVFNGDSNELIAQIADEIPAFSKSNRVLTFCFVDPFNLEIDFETMKVLSQSRALDCIINLMIPLDANRNWGLYVNQDSDRIERFLGVAHWRQRWVEAERDGRKPIQFIANEYLSAMRRLGYDKTRIEDMISVHSSKKNLPLYYMAYFSKHDLGYRFWRDVRKASTDQSALPGFDA
jgi:three-Cys-motif partner protein